MQSDVSELLAVVYGPGALVTEYAGEVHSSQRNGGHFRTQSTASSTSCCRSLLCNEWLMSCVKHSTTWCQSVISWCANFLFCFFSTLCQAALVIVWCLMALPGVPVVSSPHGQLWNPPRAHVFCREPFSVAKQCCHLRH